jgi:hypothetical protein
MKPGSLPVRRRCCPLVAVVYACLVGLNLLVLWAGVIPNLCRHVGAGG